MKKEPDPYTRVGLSSDIAVCELEEHENESNFEIRENLYVSKCFVCGEIIAPGESYDYKYCKFCSEVIRSAKDKSYSKCFECGEPFPTSQIYKFKYCPDCAERIRTCECCNQEFVFEDENSFICPSCITNLSKKCIKCGETFIPEGNYSYFCSSCYSEHQSSMEIQILNTTIHMEIHKSQNNEESNGLNSLIDDLNGNDPVKRALSFETLCSMENRGALFTVICALKNKDMNIRWKAAKYLGNFRNKDAIDYLIEALNDNEFIVRNNAVWSLGEIGDEKAVKYLNLALNDENKYVRGSAEEALEKIVNK